MISPFGIDLMKQVTAGSRSLVSKSKCLLPFVQVQILDVYMIFFIAFTHMPEINMYLSIYLLIYLCTKYVCCILIFVDIFVFYVGVGMLLGDQKTQGPPDRRVARTLLTNLEVSSPWP